MPDVHCEAADKRPVFGSFDQEYTAVEPYDLIHEIADCRTARKQLSENTTLTVTHVPSGRSKRIRMNFFAIDEYDFTLPTVIGEAAFDAWIEEVEPGRNHSPAP